MYANTIPNLPPGFFDWYKDFFGFTGKKEEVQYHMDQFIHCWKHAQSLNDTTQWTVFNSGGAVVAENVTKAKAFDYLTDERLERGWTAVCVVSKQQSSVPVETRLYDPELAAKITETGRVLMHSLATALTNGEQKPHHTGG